MFHALLWIDLRQALRSQLRAPGFLLAALVSLALGLGVNLAVFSALRAGMAGAAPWKEADRLITLGRYDSEYPQLGDQLPVSYPRFRLWKEHQQACSEITGFTTTTDALVGAGEPRNIRQLGRMEPNFFQVLGIQAQLGRTFQPEDREGILLSHSFWKKHLGGDPTIVGRTLQLGGRPHPVLGILPKKFTWRGMEVFIPLVPSAQESTQNGNWLSVLGRLKPGVTLTQAQASLNQLSTRLQAEYGTERSIRIAPRNLAEETVRRYRDGQKLILLVAASVLLLACLNVVGLLLARALARGSELGLRQALGAAPGKVFQPLLAEALVVTVPGLLLGLLFALLSQDLLAGFVPRSFRGTYGLGWMEFGFGVLLTLVIAGLCAWIPARLLPRLHLSRLLGSTRTTETPARRRTRGVILALQVGLALAMLTGFSLIQGSLNRLQDADLGFDRRTPLVARLNPPLATVADVKAAATRLKALVERLQVSPGVQAVGSINLLPVVDGGYNGNVEVPGFEGLAYSNFRQVGTGYFGAMGIPLLRGRDFFAAEVDGDSPSIIVTQRFARSYFNGREALGATVKVDTPRTIVGIVADISIDEVGQTERLETIYFPNRIAPPLAYLVVKPSGSPRAVLDLMRQEVRRQWPDMPLEGTQPLQAYLDEELEQARHQRALMGLLAGLAVALTLAGIFTVMSRNVLEQRRSFGIHASLGAAPRDLTLLVLKQGLRLTGAGLLLGLAGSVVMGSVLRNQLFGVKPFDPWFYLPSLLGLGLASLLAALLPALRAARTNPASILRSE